MTLARLFPPAALAALAVIPLPLVAQETRQMDAHVHGTGEMQIAIEGTTIAMEITVPGADIVGFEHAPGSAADRAAIDRALAQFDDAFALFTLEGDAGCTAVAKARHALGYGIEDDHDHAADAHDDHGHDDHDHAAEAGHDDHGHDDHDHAAEAGHDDHGHDEDHNHADGDTHAEFHAVYEMTCDDPATITAIGFPYFRMFENARELRVQIVSDTGAMSTTVLRDAPRLDLAGAM